MFEYALIIVLLVALGLVNWRRNVWKKRMRQLLTSQMAEGFGKAFGEAMGSTLGGMMGGKRLGQTEWPETIDEK